jgi:nitrile hydratase
MQRGLITADELEAGHALHAPDETNSKKFSVTDVERVSRRGAFGRPPAAPARFEIGERVRAINTHPKSHTRLPRYVRGHVGVVERIHGAHVFPDAIVAGKGENPQWLYTVRFDARELWGPDADPTAKVSIDAFEPYLEYA